MVMEKPSPLLVGREFVRQYYTLLNQAPDMLHRFYGKNSSYVHGGLDSNGKPADAVYGQKEIHRKVMSQNFTNCHTKIRHVDAHALRRFMQTFVLAPEVCSFIGPCSPQFWNQLFLQGGLVLFSYSYHGRPQVYVE
uniref:NTF2 domain-containing protein n=1 Tax=Microcebus murinus TaxID=30608 RepID=A0A8C5W9J3_MICMU